MNLEQMEYRCPDAKVAERVTLKDYRLVFRDEGRGMALRAFCRKKDGK